MTSSPTNVSVAVLAGGVGAARFLQGLVQIVDPEQVTAIVNTGDDTTMYGAHVSPDLDIVMYTLAGLIDEAKGWGLTGDSFKALAQLGHYGEETWFQLGDRDLATALIRTKLMREGLPLSVVTEHLRRALQVGVRLLPMTDDSVATEIETDQGWIPFQEYFVKRRHEDVVRSIRFQGIERATAGPGVLEALSTADLVVLAPSNPFVSIGTILAVSGVRDALRSRRASVVAISPIIGGAAVKGPADRMLASLGVEVSAYGVATLYGDVVGSFIIDEADAGLAPRIRDLDLQVVVTPTLMLGMAEKRALAEQTLGAVRGRSISIG